MSVISELCERVVVMNAGRNIASGTFEEIRGDETVCEAYLGEPEMSLIELDAVDAGYGENQVLHDLSVTVSEDRGELYHRPKRLWKVDHVEVHLSGWSTSGTVRSPSEERT